jgi:hypothetical protein
LELEAAVTHIVPGVIGCFACSGTDHWGSACPTRVPPKDRAEHERRIAKYVEWCTGELPEKSRITAHQKQKLIEHENAMWKQKQKELTAK